MNAVLPKPIPACRRETDLRAKHATDAEKAGYAIEDIRKALAHEDTSTTRVYLKQRAKVLSTVELSFPVKPKNSVC
jgi:integrase